MSAWGHALRRLPMADVARASEMVDYGYGRGPERRQACSAGGRPCAAPVAFAFSYRYITGRAGRVSWAEKWICQQHAERTAKRWGLELPTEAVEGPKHASEIAVEQMLGGRQL
jgi:hypothetical protein